MDWNAIGGVKARSIDDMIREVCPEIIIPEGYEYVCNVGEIYYNFDSSNFANIMVGEITKIFPPDDRADYEMVEIYWSELGKTSRGRLHEMSTSVIKDYHTDINLAKIQYYIWNKDQELSAIEFAMNDIKKRREVIDKLAAEVDLNILKEDYAEYFV